MGLKSLVENIKHTTVSIGFLKKRVPANVDVIQYKTLKGKHRAEIFHGKRAVVVLIPKKGTESGHFIVLLPRKNHIEYFSSLGNSPDKELELLEEPKQIFKDLLGSHFIYNRVPLQSGKYDVKDCAAWVLARVILSKLKLREFTKLFRQRVSLLSSDDIVSFLTVLLFIDKD